MTVNTLRPQLSSAFTATAYTEDDLTLDPLITLRCDSRVFRSGQNLAIGIVYHLCSQRNGLCTCKSGGYNGLNGFYILLGGVKMGTVAITKSDNSFWHVYNNKRNTFIALSGIFLFSCRCGPLLDVTLRVLEAFLQASRAQLSAHVQVTDHTISFELVLKAPISPAEPCSGAHYLECKS